MCKSVFLNVLFKKLKKNFYHPLFFEWRIFFSKNDLFLIFLKRVKREKS